MYLECHVVVRAPHLTTDAKHDIFDLATEFGFWGSKLTHDDSNEERAGDVILTTRGQSEPEIREKLLRLIPTARGCGYNVSRYKIEQTVMDSNIKDELALGIGRT